MRFTIKSKLISSFFVMVVLITSSGLFNITTIGDANRRMLDFSAGPFDRVQKIGTLLATINDAARSLNRSFMESNDAPRLQIHAEFNEIEAKFRSTLEQYQDTAAPEARNLIRQVAESSTAYFNEAKKVFDLVEQNTNNHALDLIDGKGKEVNIQLWNSSDHLSVSCAFFS